MVGDLAASFERRSGRVPVFATSLNCFRSRFRPCKVARLQKQVRSQVIARYPRRYPGRLNGTDVGLRAR